MNADDTAWDRALLDLGLTRGTPATPDTVVSPVRAPKEVCLSKMRFANEAEAANVARRRTALNTEGWRVNTYRCPVCSGFHLTKQFQASRR